MSQQNPYQQGTNPYYGGFSFSGNQQMVPSMQQYHGSMTSAMFQSGPRLQYPDTTAITQITCYRCKSYGHYANECPY